MDIQQKFRDFAETVSEICSHISVRDDERGFYIFALGLKGTHTLQFWKEREEFVVELWLGDNAETETVVEKSRFKEIAQAFKKARKWLERDAI